MRRVDEMLHRESLLLWVCLVCCVASVPSSQAKEDYHDVEVNKDWRECVGTKRSANCLRYLVLLGASHVNTDLNIRSKLMDPTEMVPTPPASEDPKLAEVQPRTSDSELAEHRHKLSHRPLELTPCTHALSSSYGNLAHYAGDTGRANNARVGKDSRSFTTSYALKVLLPLMFSFKQHILATAILFVLLAIKKTIILAAIIIPILNKITFKGHYIADVKFPRAHEHEHEHEHEHVYVQQMRAQPNEVRDLPPAEGYQYYVLPHATGPQGYMPELNTLGRRSTTTGHNAGNTDNRGNTKGKKQSQVGGFVH